LEKGDHLELETSAELDIKDVKIYPSMNVAAQWAVSWTFRCCYYQNENFCSAPLQGHIDHIKRVCGYLAEMLHGEL